MNIKFISLLLLSTLLLTACIRPYQPDIQQGNIINNRDLAEIHAGMGKQEVLFILGTPMIIDPFNESRWDYYYSNHDRHSRDTATRLVTVIFEDNKLIALHGDVQLDTLTELSPSTEDMQHGGSIITKPTQKEKGFLSRLLNKNKALKTKKKAKKEAKSAK